MTKAKQPSLRATLFGISDENTTLMKYIRLAQPLSEPEHLKLMLGAASKFDGSLSALKGCEQRLETEDKKEKIVRDYKAYMLHPDMVGVSIGTINADLPERKESSQTVYLNSFNAWTDNTEKAIDELAMRYSAKGGNVYPRRNLTYDEIRACALASGMSEEEFSGSMDVALDTEYIVMGGLVERIVDGKKVMVQSYDITPDVAKSLDCLMWLLKMEPKPKEVLPRHY